LSTPAQGMIRALFTVNCAKARRTGGRPAFGDNG